MIGSIQIQSTYEENYLELYSLLWKKLYSRAAIKPKLSVTLI